MVWQGPNFLGFQRGIQRPMVKISPFGTAQMFLTRVKLVTHFVMKISRILIHKDCLITTGYGGSSSLMILTIQQLKMAGHPTKINQILHISQSPKMMNGWDSLVDYK